MTSNLDQFIQTIARLRSPDGCPWDREQTHRTLARFLLEETYELLEAIHADDGEKLKEELGDMLLQVVLNAQVAKDEGRFDLEAVADAINQKMVRRHPHVFADQSTATAQEALMQWHELKELERTKAQHGRGSGQAQTNQSALDGVPSSMPALLQALKISERAVAQGFEWQEEKQIWEQLDSELAELKVEIENLKKDKERGESPNLNDFNLELGDVLFTLVNIARWHGTNPEESLLMAISKFKQRFEEMERTTVKPLKELDFEELNQLWSSAKSALSNRA
jgi:tetrapyrrole methylase family protein / MazG family protein